jgi:hypothetical protein
MTIIRRGTEKRAGLGKKGFGDGVWEGKVEKGMRKEWDGF